jgi:hypothetical protein
MKDRKLAWVRPFSRFSRRGLPNRRLGHPQLGRPRQIQELCVRRCYFSEGSAVQGGFYFTLYVSGYGNDEARALQNWGVGLKLVGNAVVQFIAALVRS